MTQGMHRRDESVGPMAPIQPVTSTRPVGLVGPMAPGPPVVPGYRLLSVIGRGAGGPVWRATRASVLSASAEPVAIKVVRVDEAAVTDPGAPAGLAELAIMRSIEHPHVVRLLDAVPLPESSLALVTAFVPGGTLGALVGACGHLRAGEVVTLLSPLARTLADLHARGIVHADLSPANVLLHEDGRPMLGDLGVARLIGTPSGSACGTSGFVAPELFHGWGCSPSSDVYGLGALAWFALCGEPPAIAVLRPPLDDVCPGLPDALRTLVESALSADPDRRPAADALARSLFDATPARPLPIDREASTSRGPRAAGIDEDSYAQMTHRIRALAAADPVLPAPRRPPLARVVGLLAAWPVALARSAVRTRSRRLPAVGAALLGLLVVLVLARPALAAHLGPHPPRTTAARTVARLSARATPSTSARATPATNPETSPTSPTTSPLTGPSTGARAATSDAALPAQGAADPITVAMLRALSATRAQVFSSGSAAHLRDLDAPGSPAWVADAEAVHRMTAAGVRYSELRIDVLAVRVESRSSRTMQVRLASRTSAYRVVTDGGRLDAMCPSRTSTVSLRLVRLGDQWRVYAIDSARA